MGGSVSTQAFDKGVVAAREGRLTDADTAFNEAMRCVELSFEDVTVVQPGLGYSGPQPPGGPLPEEDPSTSSTPVPPAQTQGKAALAVGPGDGAGLNVTLSTLGTLATLGSTATLGGTVRVGGRLPRNPLAVPVLSAAAVASTVGADDEGAVEKTLPPASGCRTCGRRFSASLRSRVVQPCHCAPNPPSSAASKHAAGPLGLDTHTMASVSSDDAAFDTVVPSPVPTPRERRDGEGRPATERGAAVSPEGSDDTAPPRPSTHSPSLLPDDTAPQEAESLERASLVSAGSCVCAAARVLAVPAAEDDEDAALLPCVDPTGAARIRAVAAAEAELRVAVDALALRRDAAGELVRAGAAAAAHRHYVVGAAVSSALFAASEPVPWPRCPPMHMTLLRGLRFEFTVGAAHTGLSVARSLRQAEDLEPRPGEIPAAAQQYLESSRALVKDAKRLLQRHAPDPRAAEHIPVFKLEAAVAAEWCDWATAVAALQRCLGLQVTHHGFDNAVTIGLQQLLLAWKGKRDHAVDDPRYVAPDVLFHALHRLSLSEQRSPVLEELPTSILRRGPTLAERRKSGAVTMLSVSSTPPPQGISVSPKGYSALRTWRAFE